VGPGEPDPDAGETAAPDALTCFARLETVQYTPAPRVSNDSVHKGPIRVAVMLYVTGANADPMADASSQLQSLINVLDQSCLRASSVTGQHQIDLQAGPITEVSPPAGLKANRMVELQFAGHVKAG